MVLEGCVLCGALSGFAFCCPECTATDDLRHLGNLQVIQFVSDGAVEHSALVPTPFPNNGNDGALDPPQMIA